MGYTLKNNCMYSRDILYCKNKLIKRSFFGIGPRYCVEFNYEKSIKCQYKKLPPKPNVI